MPFNLNDGIKKYTGLGGNDGLSSWFGRTPGIGLQDSEKSWLNQRPYDLSDGTLNDMWYSFLRADGYTGGLNDMLAAYWADPSRVIPTFAGSQYGTIDTTYVAAVGDTVEIKFATTTSGVKKFVIDGDSVSDRAFIFFSATDKIEWNAAEITALTIDGVAAISGTTSVPNDGKIHTILATLAVDARIGTIFADYTGGQVFAGELLSVKISLAAGTVVANYVFDSGSNLYQLPRGEGLGSDIADGTTPDAVTLPWVDNADGSYSIDGSQVGQVTLYYATLLSLGESYEITINVTGRTAGGIRPTSTDFNTESFFYDNGSQSWAVSAITNKAFNIQADVDFDGTVTYTIKKLPDLTCLLTNFATTDWNRYTLQKSIVRDAGTITEAWVGADLIVNGGFDTDTDWTKGTDWSIAGGVASGVAGVAGSALRQTTGTITNDKYLMKIKVSGYSLGTVYPFLAGVLGSAVTANGSYTEVITAGGTPASTGAWKTLTFVGDVDDISTQKLLEVA